MPRPERPAGRGGVDPGDRVPARWPAVQRASSASRSGRRRVVTRSTALRIRSSRIVTARMRPVRPIPPTVARNVRVPRDQRAHLAVAVDELDLVDPAPRCVPSAALVLAVHIRGDRAADREVAGAGQHRQDQPVRHHRGQHVGEAGRRGDPQRRRGHVELDMRRRDRRQHPAVHVLRGVAVAAARAPAEHPAGRPAGHQLAGPARFQRAAHQSPADGACGPSRSAPGPPARTALISSPTANMASQISSQYDHEPVPRDQVLDRLARGPRRSAGRTGPAPRASGTRAGQVPAPHPGVRARP